MGEQADMMMDGTLCESCGEYVGGTDGVALLCDRCAKARRRDGHNVQRIGAFWQDLGTALPKPLKLRCPTCRKLVKLVGLKDHQRVMHADSGVREGTNRTTSGAIGQP